MLCIGYGQIPQTLPEVGTVMFTMFGGQLMFAVFIGLASSIAKGNNSSRRLYKVMENTYKLKTSEKLLKILKLTKT